MPSAALNSWNRFEKNNQKGKVYRLFLNIWLATYNKVNENHEMELGFEYFYLLIITFIGIYSIMISLMC